MTEMTLNRKWIRAKRKAEAIDQQSIFDQTMKEKTLGIEASYRNTSSYWREEAGQALQVLARLQTYITSEDVITLLEKKGVVTSNNKAMGAVMVSAHRSGLIKPTNEWRTSKLKRRHHAPVRVWQVVK